mmetsp:Transcript_4317/g.7197  ORF Transcript_4317/g.7197 Transcript_4317/m.7197 type:complete len:201 (-) Transcript_4317:85-687(-)
MPAIFFICCSHMIWALRYHNAIRSPSSMDALNFFPITECFVLRYSSTSRGMRNTRPPTSGFGASCAHIPLSYSSASVLLWLRSNCSFSLDTDFRGASLFVFLSEAVPVSARFIRKVLQSPSSAVSIYSSSSSSSSSSFSSKSLYKLSAPAYRMLPLLDTANRDAWGEVKPQVDSSRCSTTVNAINRTTRAVIVFYVDAAL